MMGVHSQCFSLSKRFFIVVVFFVGGGGGEEGPRPLGPKEIDGQLVPPTKASTLLTDHLITG